MTFLLRKTLFLVLASFVALPAIGATELTPHTAEYKVKISLVSGMLRTELRATDSGYTATHIIKPTGMSRLITRGTMNVSSSFAAADDGVRPIMFHEVDTIRNDPETRISFDWNNNLAHGTVGDEAVQFRLAGIAHDNVSIQYALMHDLLNNGPSDTYVLFDVDKMRVANVRNVGERQVKTKAGTYTVIGIQHQKEGSSRVTTLWCAPEIGYLPIIIEQHRKGKLNFRATLTRYTPG